jgi:hypothetical protein
MAVASRVLGPMPATVHARLSVTTAAAHIVAANRPGIVTDLVTSTRPTWGGHAADWRAAGASARILRSLPDQDTVADDQHSAASGDPGNGQVRGGSAASIGQAGPPPPRGQ